MDSSAQRTEHTGAVPLGGGFALGVVLRSETGDGRECAIDATDRRAIHPDAVLRDPEDGMVARRAWLRGERETGAPADATDGPGSDLCEAPAVGSWARTQDLSVSAAQAADRSAGPRLVQRYHLHPAAAGLRISGGDHGLVQPLCAGVGGVDFTGERLLRGGTGVGIDDGAAGDLQYRPGSAVHQRGIYEPSGGAGHHDQHGRTWTSDRQHFHRTVMADGEIRRGLSEGLRGRAGSRLQPQEVFCFLQSRTPASVVGLSDASGNLLWKSEMRLRRDKAGDVMGRASWRSPFLSDPGAASFCGKLRRGTKKEKSSKKERTEGLWKLTLLMEIRKERGFPQQLEKSLAKDARSFHSSHRPNNNKHLFTIIYCRQRSTLSRLNFGPKNGERLIELGFSSCIGDAYSILRDGIEAVTHAHKISKEPKTAGVAWSDKHKGKAELAAYNKIFEEKKKDNLFPEQHGLRQLYTYYAKFSEFATHTSVTSIGKSFEDSSTGKTLRWSFHYFERDPKRMAGFLNVLLQVSAHMEEAFFGCFEARLHLGNELVRMRSGFQQLRDQQTRHLWDTYQLGS